MINSAKERQWPEKTFTPKEKEFLLEYARTNDETASLDHAGYAETQWAFKGKSILSRKESQQELALIRAELGMAEGSTLTQKEIEEEFRVIATATVTDFYDELGEVRDITELDPDKARAIKSVKRSVDRFGKVTVELVMHDKIQALQNLGKMGGFYALDEGGKGDVNIQINLPGGLAKL